jgi:hypothetical protein
MRKAYYKKSEMARENSSGQGSGVRGKREEGRGKREELPSSPFLF